MWDYFSQAQENLNPANSILDELLHYQNMTISKARNYLARFLFRGDDVYKKISTLSGGERNRLALAILTLDESNFLLLDEPTNHLDIPAQEMLQSALEAFSGTVLLVTHDRYLVNRLATQIWDLRDGRLRVFNGSYQDFLAQRDRELTQAKEATEVWRATAAASQSNNGKETLSKNALRRQEESLAALETHITQTEENLKNIQSGAANRDPRTGF